MIDRPKPAPSESYSDVIIRVARGRLSGRPLRLSAEPGCGVDNINARSHTTGALYGGPVSPRAGLIGRFRL